MCIISVERTRGTLMRAAAAERHWPYCISSAAIFRKIKTVIIASARDFIPETAARVAAI